MGGGGGHGGLQRGQGSRPFGAFGAQRGKLLGQRRVGRPQGRQVGRRRRHRGRRAGAGGTFQRRQTAFQGVQPGRHIGGQVAGQCAALGGGLGGLFGAGGQIGAGGLGGRVGRP